LRRQPLLRRLGLPGKPPLCAITSEQLAQWRDVVHDPDAAPMRGGSPDLIRADAKHVPHRVPSLDFARCGKQWARYKGTNFPMVRCGTSFGIARIKSGIATHWPRPSGIVDDITPLRKRPPESDGYKRRFPAGQVFRSSGCLRKADGRKGSASVHRTEFLRRGAEYLLSKQAPHFWKMNWRFFDWRKGSWWDTLRRIAAAASAEWNGRSAGRAPPYRRRPRSV